jgi:hypothetical protein
MKTPGHVAAARAALLDDLLRAGEALLPVDDDERHAERLCIGRRGWQRMRSGEDPVPLSIVKLWCSETGLVWETWQERFTALRREEATQTSRRDK